MKAALRPGQLRVWWIPQVPMNAFHKLVDSLKEARLLLDTLAEYDVFQFENHIKPDYCNIGGLQVYCGDTPDEEGGGWCEWEDEENGGIDCIDSSTIKAIDADWAKGVYCYETGSYLRR